MILVFIKGLQLLPPNLTEFEAVAGKIESTQLLETKAKQLREKLDVDAILITCGDKGMILADKTAAITRVVAHTREVFDVTGAGDTVVATLAVALGAGLQLYDAIKIANVAASIVIKKNWYFSY